MATTKELDAARQEAYHWKKIAEEYLKLILFLEEQLRKEKK